MATFSSTAYLTPEEAQEYFDQTLNNVAWEAATIQQQTAALLDATKIIDRLRYSGVKLSDYQTSVLGQAVSPQPLEFPRVSIQPLDVVNNPPTTPEGVLIACCLIAQALLDGVDPEIELQNIGTITQSYSTLRENYDPVVIREAFRAGVPSVQAWNYLVEYLDPSRGIKLRRV